MPRLSHRNISIACLLTALFASADISRISAATNSYGPSTSLTGFYLCFTSGGSWGSQKTLCHKRLPDVNNWYTVLWNAPSLNWNCIQGTWNAIEDQDCSEQYALGNHTNQSADATANAYIRVEFDGNVVLYKDSSYAYPVWSTNTSGWDGAALTLDSNGTLGVTYYGTYIWSTN
jgi:hypothetical protein